MSTFANYLTTGSGKVAFRLVIEGCPYEFVTDASMEGAIGDGRSRVRGLQSEGIQIQESVFMAGAELNITLSSLSVVETAGPYRDAATAAFTGWTSSSAKTWVLYGGSPSLPADVLETDTVVYVRSAAALNVGDYVHVGTEVWKITAITLAGTLSGELDLRAFPRGGDGLTIQRGLWRTTAQGFPYVRNTATASDPTLYEVSSSPASYAGRRMWLYGHGDSELSIGSTGTLLWRGLVGENPELSDSRTWSISLQPRTSLLDGMIGAGVEGNIALRGIYYPGKSPLIIDLIHYNAANPDTALQDGSARIIFVGFYETQEEFCTALRTAITTNGTVATWTGTWDVRVRADGTAAGVWDLVYTPDAVSPKAVQVGGGSPVDGWFVGMWFNADVSSSVFIGTHGSVRTVVAGQQYVAAIVGPTSMAGGYAGHLPDAAVRKVPRANYQLGMSYRGSDANATTYPLGRFYLASDPGGSGAYGSTITVTPPKVDDADPDNAPINFTVSGTSADGGTNVSDGDSLILGATTHGLSGFACAGTDYQPTIQIALRFGSAGGNNLATFMNDVLAQSPRTANLGTSPWLTSDDYDASGSLTEVIVAAASRTWATNRDYVFTKAVKLLDVIREELKLLGMYMCLDSGGRITFKRFPQDGATIPSTSIDATSHIVGDDFGGVKLSPDGVIGSVVVKTRYDRANDKWAQTYDFKQPNAAATIKSKAVKLEIAPVVRSLATTAEPSASDCLEIAQHALAWFGKQYYVVTVPVAITKHTLRIGDSVLLTIPQLPYGGARGATTSGSGLYQTRATVVGRQWMYGDSPSGTLDLFIHGLNTSGYAPTCNVASASGSGVSWTLTCDGTAYGPGTVADASFFATGYKVVLRQWDSDAPTRITGTVVSVSGNDIAVTLDTAWAGMGGQVWKLSFGSARDVTAAQRAYVFMADGFGRITYSDTGASPRVFS